MATKEELKQQLEGNERVKRLIHLDTRQEANERDYYEVYRYYWDDNGVLRSEAVIIHVLVDENGNEIAYWKDKIPTVLRPIPETTFRDELEQKIEQVKDQFNIENYFIEQVDNRRQVATVTVYVTGDQDNVIETRLLVWKDKDGNWYYKRIG